MDFMGKDIKKSNETETKIKKHYQPLRITIQTLNFKPQTLNFFVGLSN